MAFTPEQIETVREIILLTSYSETATLVSYLNAVQETATIDDIADWVAVRNKFTPVTRVGSIHLNADKANNRLAITNRVRRRLGLPAIDSEADLNSPAEICYTTPVLTDCGGCE